MHKIEKAPIGCFTAYRLVNSKGEYLEVLPELGAALNNLVIEAADGRRHSLISGYRTEEQVVRTHHSSFLGSKLSPICNRIPEGKFDFEEESYQLVVNEVDRNNHLHGLLHCRPFEVISRLEGGEEAGIVLKHHYKGVDQGFPFPYELEISITLHDQKIRLLSKVTNVGDGSMPYTDGWHPYFSFETIDHVKFQLTGADRCSSMVGNEIGGRQAYESMKTIGSTIMDDCFKLDEAPEGVAILEDSTSGLGIKLAQKSESDGYQYIQLYIPDSRDKIALEPVSAPPNSFNTGEGLLVLKSGECHEYEVTLDYYQL